MSTSRTRIVTVVAAAWMLFALSPDAIAAQSGRALAQAVENALDEERELRRLDVTAEGDQVTLTGEVRTFWEKNEALRITFGVEGVDTVVSEIVVPAADSEQDLIEDVTNAIQRYSHYRMWDQIDASLLDGVVTMTGRVTPERDKARELFERVAKVRGVQDVQVDIEALSPSSSDRRIRQAIASRLFRSEHFERWRSGINTPFHVIVDNGHVTLLGYVQSRIEYIEMERIVGQTPNVLRVDNQLQTIQ